jgi:hypothetical protein
MAADSTHRFLELVIPRTMPLAPDRAATLDLFSRYCPPPADGSQADQHIGVLAGQRLCIKEADESIWLVSLGRPASDAPVALSQR